MNKNKKKEASQIVGLHEKEDFPELLEGSEDNYSVDVQALFDDGRKCKVFYAFNANCWYYETPNDVMTPVEGNFRWTYLLESDKYPSMDACKQTDKMREYLIGQIEAALHCVKGSIIKVPTAKDVALKVALCCPTRLFAANEFYRVSSLCLNNSGDNVLCHLEYNKAHAVPLPIQQISVDGLNIIVRWLKDKQFINTCYPAPIPISGKFWNFIEQILPDYHTRYDVLRQSELQLFIDGKTFSATGLTREEAIRERDQILYRIYAEAIHAFTCPSLPKDMPEDGDEIDENEIIEDILKGSGKCGAFMDVLGNEIGSDEEKYSRKGRQVLTAYLENDCAGMLMALCGWSMESLLRKYVETIKDIPAEEKEEE